MKESTLRAMTTELCGRTMNTALEEHLAEYATDLTGLMSAVRSVSRQFPEELVPSAVFSLKPAESLRDK